MTGTEEDAMTPFDTIALAPLPTPMERLRAQLAAAGWRAESPAVLDPDAERMAREERLS